MSQEDYLKYILEMAMISGIQFDDVKRHGELKLIKLPVEDPIDWDFSSNLTEVFTDEPDISEGQEVEVEEWKWILKGGNEVSKKQVEMLVEKPKITIRPRPEPVSRSMRWPWMTKKSRSLRKEIDENKSVEREDHDKEWLQSIGFEALTNELITEFLQHGYSERENYIASLLSEKMSSHTYD